MYTITAVALAAVAILVLLLLLNRRDRLALAGKTAELADSEARWRQLAETVPAGLSHIAADGPRRYVNPRLPEIPGAPPAAPGDARAWLVYDADMALLKEHWATAGAAKTDVSVSFRIRRMNDDAIR